MLPPTLTHPTISLMALVIRDAGNFHTKGYAVPKVADLRLFTAGSDSTELVERCLKTGRILVRHNRCTPLMTAHYTYPRFPSLVTIRLPDSHPALPLHHLAHPLLPLHPSRPVGTAPSAPVPIRRPAVPLQNSVHRLGTAQTRHQRRRGRVEG